MKHCLTTRRVKETTLAKFIWRRKQRLRQKSLSKHCVHTHSSSAVRDYEQNSRFQFHLQVKGFALTFWLVYNLSNCFVVAMLPRCSNLAMSLVSKMLSSPAEREMAKTTTGLQVYSHASSSVRQHLTLFANIIIATSRLKWQCHHVDLSVGTVSTNP